MNKLLFTIFDLLTHQTCFGQYRKVKISDYNRPEEPSICINPFNTNIIVAAANINNYYNSSDGENTWTIKTLQSDYGVWGDPCIIADKYGHFYFFHSSNPEPSGSWIDRIVCQKTRTTATRGTIRHSWD